MYLNKLIILTAFDSFEVALSTTDESLDSIKIAVFTVLFCKAEVKITITFSKVLEGQVLVNNTAYYISALSCQTAPCQAQQCWKQDQKYKIKTNTKTKAAIPRPRRPRRRPV